MEDITLALVTLTSFVLLFVAAIFADRAGAELEAEESADAIPVTVDVAVFPDPSGTAVDAA